MTNREKKFTLLLVLAVVVAAIYHLVEYDILLIDVKDGVNLLVASGTIGMTSVIILIQVIRPWMRKPEIKIEFANERPYCRHAKTETGLRPYYGHFAVINSGQTPADDCEAVLERVWDSSNEKKNSEWEEWKNFIPCNLKWSGEDRHKDFERACFKTVYPGERRYFCDIGRVDEGYDIFNFELSRAFLSQVNCLSRGKYKIQISVYSKNAAKVTKKFVVEWSGVWKEKQKDMEKSLEINLDIKRKSIGRKANNG